MNELKGRRIAILVTDGFEQVEMTEPRKALQDAGAATDLISPVAGTVKGWNHTDWDKKFPVDVELSKADPDNYDALLLPGGVMNPDKLRMDPKAIKFVQSFVDASKPIAAICHGPWILLETDNAVHGRTMTSWPSLRTDLRNGGANWVDKEVVVDNGLVTSRKPADLPAFNRRMIEEFGEGVHASPGASRQERKLEKGNVR